ncbi:hypothetical protein HPB47_008159, partial [Ixodes persulcatus]
MELGVPTYAPLSSSHQPRGENGSARRCAIPPTHHVKQGRAILSTLGYPTAHISPLPKQTPPWDTMPRIAVKPIPRHMTPTMDLGRRQSRALHLSTPQHDIYYTDAAFTDGNSTTVK